MRLLLTHSEVFYLNITVVTGGFFCSIPLLSINNAVGPDWNYEKMFSPFPLSYIQGFNPAYIYIYMYVYTLHILI